MAPHQGNLFRALLIGVVIMGLILFIGTDLAPLFRETGEMVGLTFPEGYGEVFAWALALRWCPGCW
ncbi:hypothetical protein [Candidatus Hakubella thermalkaliphila]|uniref:Uncharacterized protein n=1 Tax=Candidatus Hakubella thermalkaliphila TaxID=2754717 RepID=A0A6V8QBG8_9ACTN|nr:hypothetical protein [Candidatus Hakubella thermalkaliphila]GFP40231.1 hypothetical protein HKBW3S47_01927 [Candidatus Hakubella thermalkaliphila]